MRKGKLPFRWTAVLLCLALLLSACGGETEREAGPAAPAEATESAAIEEKQPETAPDPTPQPTAEPIETSVELSELMAVNRSCLPDADGDFSDWIELFNAGNETQALGGFWLSDDSRTWNKWQFPEGLTLAPGERILVFCSGKDSRDGELHASFSLSGDGETLVLSGPEGQPLWERSFPALEPDQAVCWDGGEPRLTRFATPGFDNSEEGYETFVTTTDAHGALVISEAVLYNSDYAFHSSSYYDWVELCNASDEPVRLSDYALSDDRNDRMKFRLPDRMLEPGGLFLLFCGEPYGETAFCHAPFGLDGAGESLYLTGPEGELSDYVGLYGIPFGASKGRSEDGAGFFFYERRTPDAKNGEGFRFISAAPTASLAPGVYENPEGLELRIEGPGPVFYTLSGALPTARAEQLEGALHLEKTTVIRAVCREPGKLPSEVRNFSYILNEGHSLPVVSVLCDPADYQMVFGQESDGSYPAHITLLNGGEGFDRDCSIKLHGASSRAIWVKKSLKVIFKGRYGGDLEYDLFGNGITSYHSILLRGGYTTFMQMMRDPLASLVANKVCEEDPLTLDSRYCILYLNGRYGGIYCFREAYSTAYVASHTGADESTVKIEKAVINYGYNDDELAGVLNEILNSDMSVPENYASVSERLDMLSLAQWVCLESYFDNLDALGNIRYAKGNLPDGRWRLMLFDFDLSMASETASMGTMLSGNMQISSVILSLRRNEDFRRLMLETAGKMYRSGLNSEDVLAVFDEMAETVSPEITRDIKTFELAPRSAYDMFIAAQRARLGPLRDASWLEGIRQFCGASEEEMRDTFPGYYD